MKEIPNNPYKDLDPDEKRQVLAKVSQEDFDRLYNCCPCHGLQDKVISIIFKAFIQALEDNGIKRHYEPENPGRIASLLRGITFQRVSDEGGQSRRPNRRAKKSAVERVANTETECSNSPQCGNEAGEEDKREG